MGEEYLARSEAYEPEPLSLHCEACQASLRAPLQAHVAELEERAIAMEEIVKAAIVWASTQRGSSEEDEAAEALLHAVIRLER